MKEKKKEMQKQVLTLLGILIFCLCQCVYLIIKDKHIDKGFCCLSQTSRRQIVNYPY